MNKNILIFSAIAVALLFVISGCSNNPGTYQSNSSNNSSCSLNTSSCGGSPTPVLTPSSNNSGNTAPGATDNITVQIANTTSITNISVQIGNGSNLINDW